MSRRGRIVARQRATLLGDGISMRLFDMNNEAILENGSPCGFSLSDCGCPKPSDQEEQEKRFAERREDPLKGWKLSPIDLEARTKYAEYTKAREAMLKATHTKHAPWTLVDFNDQKRGRLTLIRDLLDRMPDTETKTEPLEFPPLEGKLQKEKYSVVKPLDAFEA